MEVKSTKKKGASPVRKVVFYMPADLAKKLKVYVAEQDTNMSAFVNRLVIQALEKGEKQQ